MRQFLVNIVDMCFFLFYLIVKEDFTNYIKRRVNECVSDKKIVHVLANGPSLSDALNGIKNKWDEYKNDDFCAVNFFANTDSYSVIMPKYYVLSDPKFFGDGIHHEAQIKELYENMNMQTIWRMYLFVPYIHYKKFNVITNKNIVVVPFHYRPYIGFEALRFFFYKNGLGNGEFGTVVLNAEYMLINIGYKVINLYGVDHNYCNGLVVTDDNQACFKYLHVGENDTKLVPIILGPKHGAKLYEFFKEMEMIFRGHIIMNEYAKSLGCQIINCTKGSFIDAYVRKNHNE